MDESYESYESYAWEEEIYDIGETDFMSHAGGPFEMSLNTSPLGINMPDSTLETDFMSHAGGGSKKRNNLPKSIRRLKIKIPSRQNAKLARSYLINENALEKIRLEKEEKLIIMFKLDNKHAIFRLKDGAIAVLKDAIFNHRNPPTLMDGSKYKDKLLNSRVVLLYAISKIDQVDENEVRLRESDVLLVVAQSRRYVVGVTAEKKVGIFDASNITLLTEPRLYIGCGQILSVGATKDFAAAKHDVKSIKRGTIYEILKGSTGLFNWFENANQGQRVFLHAIQETTLQQDSGLPHQRPIRSMSRADESYNKIVDFVYGNIPISEKRKEPLPQPHVDEKDNSLSDESLESEMWFFGNISRREAEEKLINNGDFLVRHKTDRQWEFVLSFKHNNVINHMELLLKEGSYYKTHGGRFKSLRMLIHTHFEMKSSLSLTDKTMILTYPLCRDDYDLDESKLFHQYTKGQRSPDVEGESLSQNQHSKDIRESTSISDDGEESTGKDRPFVRKAIEKIEGKKKPYKKLYLQEREFPFPADKEGRAASTYTDSDQDHEQLQGDSEPTTSTYMPSYGANQEGDSKHTYENVVLSAANGNSQDKSLPLPTMTYENVVLSAANGNSQDKSLPLPTMTTSTYMTSYGANQEGASEPTTSTYMTSYGANQEGDSEPTTSTYMPSYGANQEGDSEPTTSTYMPSYGANQEGDSEPETVVPSAANGNSQDKSLLLPTMMYDILPSAGNGNSQDKSLPLPIMASTFSGKGARLGIKASKDGLLENLSYVEQYVDETGGELCVPSTTVKVSIPPNALTSGEIISITILEDDLFESAEFARICPVISLDPDGLEFNKSVEVTLSHCGMIEDGNQHEATVYSGRFVEDKYFLWTSLSGTQCTLSNNLCHFHLNHFCYVDVKVGVKGKRVKVVPVAEKVHAGQDLLMTCWILNSYPIQDIEEELKYIARRHLKVLDSCQEFLVLDSEKPLHGIVTSYNEEWNPITLHKIIPFNRIWHTAKICFKFRHELVSGTAAEDPSLNFGLVVTQPENDELDFYIQAKQEDVFEESEEEEDIYEDVYDDTMLHPYAQRLDKRDCMRLATYFDLPPEAVDYIKESNKMGIALFTELRKRNFYDDSCIDILIQALHHVQLRECASQLEADFPDIMNTTRSNVQAPDPFGNLKVQVSDKLSRQDSIIIARLSNLAVAFQDLLDKDVTPGITLISELEKQGLFGKNNVRKFSKILKDLQFKNLSQLLKQFRKEHQGFETKSSLFLGHKCTLIKESYR